MSIPAVYRHRFYFTNFAIIGLQILAMAAWYSINGLLLNGNSVTSFFNISIVMQLLIVGGWVGFNIQLTIVFSAVAAFHLQRIVGNGKETNHTISIDPINPYGIAWIYKWHGIDRRTPFRIFINIIATTVVLIAIIYSIVEWNNWDYIVVIEWLCVIWQITSEIGVIFGICIMLMLFKTQFSGDPYELVAYTVNRIKQIEDEIKQKEKEDRTEFVKQIEMLHAELRELTRKLHLYREWIHFCDRHPFERKYTVNELASELHTTSENVVFLFNHLFPPTQSNRFAAWKIKRINYTNLIDVNAKIYEPSDLSTIKDARVLNMATYVATKGFWEPFHLNPHDPNHAAFDFKHRHLFIEKIKQIKSMVAIGGSFTVVTRFLNPDTIAIISMILDFFL